MSILYWWEDDGFWSTSKPPIGATKIKLNMKRIHLALHNIIGHPLMEIAYIFGLRSVGNYIHNQLFKIDHE